MENHSFDRFNDKPPRRERREDRFSDRPRRFGDREDRFSNRSRHSEERPSRFGERSDRPFAAREDRGGFGRTPRRDFGSRSGPRAKAVDRRRFSDHKAFVNSSTVRLDADVAEYFKSSESVNEALRQLIALSALVKKSEVKEVVAETSGDAVPEVVESEAFISEDAFEDTQSISDKE